MKCNVPIIKIGDLVKVTMKNDYRVYELTDVAVWQNSLLIKTIEMTYLELPYDPSKRDKKNYKNKINKAKIRLRRNDRILIKTKHDIATYGVFVTGQYQEESKIGKVFFTKLINPSGRC